MTKAQVFSRNLFAVFGIASLLLGCWLFWNIIDRPKVSAQDDKRAATRPTPDKEQPIAVALKNLLSNKGIVLDETTLLPRQVERSRTARIQLRTVSSRSFSSEEPASSEVLLSKIVESAGQLTRPRSLDLATTQILVIAVDRNSAARWWSLSPDSRLVRAETSDASEALSGQTIYRRDSSMLISYPDDPSITALHLFHPTWDGQRFSLELIGGVDILTRAGAR